jgi:O-antigen ligase
VSASTTTVRPPAALATGLGALLLLVLPWRGGAAPTGTLVWHGAVVGLLLAATLVPRLVAGAHRAAPAPVAAFALLCAVAAAGAVVAPYRYAALLMLLELGAFAAVAWLASRAGPRPVPALGWALLVAALVQSALAVVQRFVDGVERPAGTFENPNHLGAWLVAVLLLQAGALFGAESRRARALRAAASLPLLVALFLGGSRGALLGLGVGGAYLLGLGWRARRGAVAAPDAARSRSRPIVVGATALLLLVAGTLGIRQWQRLREGDPFRYHRLRIWSASVAAASHSPWTGVGPRQFAPAAENLQFADGEGPLRYDRVFRRTHSDPLRVFAELGFPGLLALGLAVLATVATVVRRNGAGASSGPASRAGPVAALLALATHACFANPSERPAVWVLAAVLLGGLIARPAAGVAARSTARPATRLVLAVLLLGGYLLADVSPWLAWRSAQTTAADPGSAEETRRLEWAMRRNPLHPDYRLRLAGSIVAAGSDWDLRRYARARELAESAVRLQPADARYRAGLARIDAHAARTLFAGDPASRRRAAARFVEAESLSRYNPYLPLERAAFLLATGDPLGAQRAARRALGIEPESSAARLVLAEALLAAGTPGVAARARELIDEAAAIAERWSGQHLANPESARLLTLDPRALDRLQRALGALGP